MTMSYCTTASKQVTLDSGTLTVDVAESQLPLDALCRFATRLNNPKRGFLFVSPVLGKHIPTTPSTMQNIYHRLASAIAVDLPGPVLFIGMAETAIAIGHGVHAEYVEQTERDDVLYLHTTRYKLSQPVACEFLEEHSHATDHLIYQPLSEANQHLLQNVRSVVLVDDEASSGKTFVNLARALQKTYPSIENVVTVVITDWRGEEKTQQNRDQIAAKYTSVSVLSGQYEFVPRKDLKAEPMPGVTGNGELKDDLFKTNYGRLGVRVTELGITERAARLNVHAGERILVLGTGEFAYPPFLLAQQLERNGAEVYCQSTTRSPVRLGGAIASVFQFRDNYEDGIPNFIYNADPRDYDRVIICHETPADSIDPRLINHFDAELVQF